MTTNFNPYAGRSRRYLNQAEEEFARGDLLQASEKGWGATSQMLKALASERGWQHRRHNNLYEAVDKLIEETNDYEFRPLFAAAGALHTNFYEEFLEDDEVHDHLDQVIRFVDKMEALLAAE